MKYKPKYLYRKKFTWLVERSFFGVDTLPVEECKIEWGIRTFVGEPLLVFYYRPEKLWYFVDLDNKVGHWDIGPEGNFNDNYVFKTWKAGTPLKVIDDYVGAFLKQELAYHMEEGETSWEDVFNEHKDDGVDFTLQR